MYAIDVLVAAIGQPATGHGKNPPFFELVGICSAFREA
jgi:hypothetical protein